MLSIDSTFSLIEQILFSIPGKHDELHRHDGLAIAAEGALNVWVRYLVGVFLQT